LAAVNQKLRQANMPEINVTPAAMYNYLIADGIMVPYSDKIKTKKHGGVSYMRFNKGHLAYKYEDIVSPVEHEPIVNNTPTSPMSTLSQEPVPSVTHNMPGFFNS